MKYLYLLTQDFNRGYDTFDSCVVCADSEEAAKQIHPRGAIYVESRWCEEDRYMVWGGWGDNDWAFKPEQVTVVRIGVADESTAIGVVCASFNAG
jgi:hypothetical protein